MEQLLGGGIHPVGIFEHHQQWPMHRQADHLFPQRPELVQALLGRIVTFESHGSFELTAAAFSSVASGYP